MQISVSRGNRLSAPWALLLTVIGAGFILFGVFGPVGSIFPGPTGFTDVLLWLIAGVVVFFGWWLSAVIFVATLRKRRAPIGEVPDELAQPPGNDPAALVAVVVGRGKPSGRAIAATVLELARRGVIEVNEYGPKLVISVAPDAAGADEGERLVLAALREDTEADGDVSGPPIWKRRARWWRDFRRDAQTRAQAAELIEPWVPFVALTLALIFAAVGVSLVLFEYIFIFVGSILLANGLPHLILPVGGYRLTSKGKQLEAEWRAFGRYLRAQGSVRDVGPAAIAIWGPNLVYGVVLGEAERAAHALTPEELEDGPASGDASSTTVHL